MMIILAAVNSHFQTHITKALPFYKQQGNSCRNKAAVNEDTQAEWDSKLS